MKENILFIFLLIIVIGVSSCTPTTTLPELPQTLTTEPPTKPGAEIEGTTIDDDALSSGSGGRVRAMINPLSEQNDIGDYLDNPFFSEECKAYRFQRLKDGALYFIRSKIDTYCINNPETNLAEFKTWREIQDMMTNFGNNEWDFYNDIDSVLCINDNPFSINSDSFTYGGNKVLMNFASDATKDYYCSEEENTPLVRLGKEYLFSESCGDRQYVKDDILYLSADWLDSSCIKNPNKGTIQEIHIPYHKKSDCIDEPKYLCINGYPNSVTVCNVEIDGIVYHDVGVGIYYGLSYKCPEPESGISTKIERRTSIDLYYSSACKNKQQIIDNDLYLIMNSYSDDVCLRDPLDDWGANEINSNRLTCNYDGENSEDKCIDGTPVRVRKCRPFSDIFRYVYVGFNLEWSHVCEGEDKSTIREKTAHDIYYDEGCGDRQYYDTSTGELHLFENWAGDICYKDFDGRRYIQSPRNLDCSFSGWWSDLDENNKLICNNNKVYYSRLCRTSYFHNFDVWIDEELIFHTCDGEKVVFGGAEDILYTPRCLEEGGQKVDFQKYIDDKLYLISNKDEKYCTKKKEAESIEFLNKDEFGCLLVTYEGDMCIENVPYSINHCIFFYTLNYNENLYFADDLSETHHCANGQVYPKA